jgi:hypothetical protein
MESKAQDENPLGVRARLEQYLANPECETNRNSALLNVSIAEVVADLKSKSLIKNWVEPKGSGISKIASKLGKLFEASLFENDCKYALEIATKLAFTADQVNESVRFVDCKPAEVHLRDRIAYSKDLLSEMAKSDGIGLWVLNGFHLPVDILEEDTHLEIDVVLASRKKSGALEMHLGEVKIYPFKAGRTNPHQLETARAQLGLYHYLMQGVIRDCNLEGSVNLSQDGFLVLQDLKTGEPYVEGREDLTFLSERARQAVSLVSGPEVTLRINPNRALARVVDSGHRFQESCWVQCELAQQCHSELVERDKPMVLGELANSILGNGSLPVQAALNLIESRFENVELTELECDLKGRFGESNFTEIENFSWR